MSKSRWTRRAFAVVAAAVALATLSPFATASASVPVLVLDGTGYGHGVGLSQWGAEYLARTGQSAEQILATFYPGAGLGQATGSVSVAVHNPPTSTTTLSFPQGGEVRSGLGGDQAPGFPVRVGPGGRVRITYDGSYRVEALMGAQSAAAPTAYQQDPCALVTVCTAPPPPTPPTTAPTTTTTAPPPPPGGPGTTQPGNPGTSPPPPPAQGSGAAASSQPVWAVPAGGGVTTVDDRGRSYRGAIEATGAGDLRLVNHVDVEDYLRGMAEVPSTWPAAAVQAQTIAARTYALRAMRAGGELCDDARCQVYVGRTAESPGQAAAVAATAKRVLTYGGALAAAVYSADAGGMSATTLEGFGTPDGTYPYLKAVKYDTDNPLPWHTEVALSDVAARSGYPGTLTGVRVGQTGPSGRALQMVLSGSAGDRTVDGRRFAQSLGLRSTRFAASVGSSDAAPPPPPPDEGAIQAMPDEAAALARRPVGTMAGNRYDRATDGAVKAGAPALPDALDPRRHPLTLLAVVAAAGLVGAHLPLLLAPNGGIGAVRRRWRGARGWAPWRLLTRSR
jgi:stage II sporulation protein D